VDRLERLVNLVVALLDTPRPLTREELRQRVGGYSDDATNFHRNFERDKDLLRQMGIPIVAETLPGNEPSDRLTGYRVPRQLYELPDPGLDEDELLALSLAVSAVAFDGSAQGAATTALWKLAAVSAERAGGNDRVAPPLADVPTDERVASLFSGVHERRVARFEYNGVARQVDPYRLSYRQGRWYLAGFDRAREAERLFRVDRVTGPVELEGPPGQFVRPEGVASVPPPPWRLGDDEEIVVELRVEASQAGWVRSLAGEESVAGTSPDGWVDFKLPVTNRAALRSFVLGLLDRAEVIGPPEVRDEIVDWLRGLAGASPRAARTEGPAPRHGPRPPVRQRSSAQADVPRHTADEAPSAIEPVAGPHL
jgi:proteasome accessory factor B